MSHIYLNFTYEYLVLKQVTIFKLPKQTVQFVNLKILKLHNIPRHSQYFIRNLKKIKKRQQPINILKKDCQLYTRDIELSTHQRPQGKNVRTFKFVHFQIYFLGHYAYM